MKNLQLIFVYNADNGLFAIISDFTHKILSPSTYRCRLCALTYGNFAIKNEFMKQQKIDEPLPAVFIKYGNNMQTFLTKEEIEYCTTLQQLKDAILFKISKL